MAKLLKPEAAQGGSKPKFSSRLMQMKFMQRAQAPQAAAVEDAAAEDIKQEEQTEWTLRGDAAGGCRLIAEADPRPGARVGRLSFSGKGAAEEPAQAEATRQGAEGDAAGEAAQVPRDVGSVDERPAADDQGARSGVKRSAEGYDPLNDPRPNKFRKNMPRKPQTKSKYTW